MSKLTKLFVGNIPWTIGSRELRKYFAAYGRVVSADVLFDHSTGFSKGFGFVQFSTPGGLESVLKTFTHELDGQALSVKIANSR